MWNNLLHTGNGFLPFCMLSVDWHVGRPVFFTGLSNAHTFNTGSLEISSYSKSDQYSFPMPHVHTDIVTNKDVPSTCFMCVIEPVSCAWNVRRILKDGESMRTTPSWLPRKRLSEPEQTQLISLLSKKDRLSSSGGLTWLTSKKSNVFHCSMSAKPANCAPQFSRA